MYEQLAQVVTQLLPRVGFEPTTASSTLYPLHQRATSSHPYIRYRGEITTCSFSNSRVCEVYIGTETASRFLNVCTLVSCKFLVMQSKPHTYAYLCRSIIVWNVSLT